MAVTLSASLVRAMSDRCLSSPIRQFYFPEISSVEKLCLLHYCNCILLELCEKIKIDGRREY